MGFSLVQLVRALILLLTNICRIHLFCLQSLFTTHSADYKPICDSEQCALSDTLGFAQCTTVIQSHDNSVGRDNFLTDDISIGWSDNEAVIRCDCSRRFPQQI